MCTKQLCKWVRNHPEDIIHGRKSCLGQQTKVVSGSKDNCFVILVQETVLLI